MNENLIFNTYPQISAWAGKTNGVHMLEGDRDLPYIEKEGLFWYFGQNPDDPNPSYRLICTSLRDLGE